MLYLKRQPDERQRGLLDMKHVPVQRAHLQKNIRFPTCPTFVPSLSWQMIDVLVLKRRNKHVSAPSARSSRAAARCPAGTQTDTCSPLPARRDRLALPARPCTKRISVLECSLCLSRACLGRIIIHFIKPQKRRRMKRLKRRAFCSHPAALAANATSPLALTAVGSGR